MNVTVGSEDKLPCLENGSMQQENESKKSFVNRVKKHGSCSQLLQIAKVILYFELGFLIGWIGCVYLWNSMGNASYNGSTSGIARSSAFTAMKITPPDFNNLMDFEYSLMINRGKRSTEEDEVKREECMRSVNATNERFQELINQIIIGKDSDETIIMLREKCRRQLVVLTLSALTMDLTSSPDSPRPTNDEWRSMALGIKEGILNETAGEYRQQVEASGPPSKQIIYFIRKAIQSMITNYRNCEKILPFAGQPTSEFSLADLMNLRDQCSRTFVAMKEDLRPFEAQIVPGNASDPVIAELRGKLENLAATFASALTVRKEIDLNVTELAATIANYTDQQILENIALVKDDLLSTTDPEHRRQLEESGPPTQTMVTAVRTLISKYLGDVVMCDEMQGLIEELRSSVNSDGMPRFKRNATLQPKQT